MWPWEHVAIAYVCYSVGLRALGRKPRSDHAVLVLVVAALLPDVIDKPLAWQWDVFESSYSIGHSLFVAVPSSFVILLVSYYYGRLETGYAAIVGLFSHLVADLIPSIVRFGEVPIERVLWPLTTPQSASSHGSFLNGLWHYVHGSASALGEGELGLYILAQIGLGAAALGLWFADGKPGRRWFSRE